MVIADKTVNMYMWKEEYVKVINDNVTKTYLKVTTSTEKIDKVTKHFPKKVKLENKIEQYVDQSAYVKLKDHKENFNTKLLCPLIITVKREIGTVYKVEAEKINRQ